MTAVLSLDLHDRYMMGLSWHQRCTSGDNRQLDEYFKEKRVKIPMFVAENSSPLKIVIQNANSESRRQWRTQAEKKIT